MERTCEQCGKQLTEAEKELSVDTGHDWCAICAMREYERPFENRSIFGRIRDAIYTNASKKAHAL